MTRADRNRLAGYVFADVFARESNREPEVRLEIAIGAAVDVALAANPAIAARIEERKPPSVVNEVGEVLLWNRARRAIAAVALAHDLTSDVLIGRRRDAAAQVARDEAFAVLARGNDPLSQRQVAQVFGRSEHAVRLGMARHEARGIEERAPQQREANGG